MRFYVYEHWRPDQDVPFYVGKGTGRRAHYMGNRNALHKRVQVELDTLGMCVEVRLFRSGLTNEEAAALEIERIAFWRTANVWLANQTKGGDGIKGFFNQPLESRLRRSRSMTGLVRSEETKHKIRVAKSNPSLDTRERNRAAAVASWANPVWRAKQIEARIGVIRITDGYVNRTIGPVDGIPEGWRRGMVKRRRELETT